MPVRWLAPLVVALAAAACGAPSIVSPTAAGISAGQVYTYGLAIVAPETVTINGQVVSACPGAERLNLSFIEANAIGGVDGDASLYRPSAARDGDFELRLVRDLAVPSHRSGTIRGRVINTRTAPLVVGPPYDGLAIFSGATPDLPVAFQTGFAGSSSGLIAGVVTLSTSSGATVTCAPGTVYWLLSYDLR